MFNFSDPGRFERVFEILEKNLRKSPLNWEVVVRNVQGIDGKMVLPTLARLAVTKLNVEETKILVDAIQKVKITHSLEGATPLERNEGVKVPFMSKQIKKGSKFILAIQLFIYFKPFDFRCL